MLLLPPITPSFACSPGLWGITEHRGWSVQTQKAAQRRGAGGRHTIINWRLRAARLWKPVCFCRASTTVNTAAYWATWRQINKGITRLRTAILGGIKGRGTEEQKWKEDWGEPSATWGWRSECVWQGVWKNESVSGCFSVWSPLLSLCRNTFSNTDFWGGEQTNRDLRIQAAMEQTLAGVCLRNQIRLMHFYLTLSKLLDVPKCSPTNVVMDLSVLDCWPVKT